MKSPATARHALISGRVQGVAFRWCTREEAGRLGVDGWVRNLADGRVEVWAEGGSGAVTAMVDWLYHGPTGAQVTSAEILEVIPEGFESFSVRPDN